MRTAVVFVGGPHRVTGPQPAHPALVGLHAQRVVAVDSGLHLAEALGWRADVVVGDMDSVDPALLERARAGGAAVERHPEDKDATDLELALDGLLVDEVDRAVVIGADGGRMDHLIGGLLTLCAPRYAPLRLRAWLGGALVVPVRDTERFSGRPGRQVSILPVHGTAEGVRTDGLRWPLHGERLTAGSSRGISNQMVSDAAAVSVDGGCVAVVLPEEER